MAVAAYGDETATLSGPYQPVFDEMIIGLSIPNRWTVDGWWKAGTIHNEVRFIIAGMGRDSLVRVDALWRGGIIARTTPAAGKTALPPPPRELRITAAVLLRDQPISLAEILSQSKMVGEHLREAGVERARQADTSTRAPILVVWMVSEAIFDDDDWPGGGSGTPAEKRLRRRRAAAAWLGPQGIVFAPTPKHP
jgi:hypothetical protein